MTTTKSETARREVPAWLNLDALYTAEDLRRVDALRRKLEELAETIVDLHPEIAFAKSLCDRWDIPLDHGWEFIETFSGVDGVRAMLSICTWLMDPTDEAIDQPEAVWELAQQWGSTSVQKEIYADVRENDEGGARCPTCGTPGDWSLPDMPDASCPLCTAQARETKSNT